MTRSLELMALAMTPESSRRALESVIQQTHPRIDVEFGGDGRVQYTLNRDNPPLEELAAPKPTSEEVP